jgi:hypothetical protein
MITDALKRVGGRLRMMRIIECALDRKVSWNEHKSDCKWCGTFVD